MTLTDADLEVLKQWDTPTICNGLEVVSPERRALGFTTEQLHCFDPALAPMVGYARTATIRAVTPATEPADVMREQRARYYEYVASGASPTVVIIQDLDPNPGFGAFWGEVNTAVHKGLGALGVVTNGSIRDLDECAPGFQLLAGKIGPSHAHVHVVGFGETVDVYGLVAEHDDVIHADRHGAVVIPREVVKALPAAIDLLTRREAVILGAARGEGFDIEVLKRAMADSAEIH
ncbi:MAG: RraA family protein [Gammaproteobacteria bacterium]